MTTLIFFPFAIILGAFALDNTNGKADENPIASNICFILALLIVVLIIIFPSI